VVKVGAQRTPEHLIKIDRSIWACNAGIMAMGKKGGAQDGLFVA
jgi:hypothetical protein